MKRWCHYAYVFAAALAAWCGSPVRAIAQAEPRTAEGHPDLSGVWNGATMGGPYIKVEDERAALLPARDGALVNFERDNTLIRRSNPNKPLYKPEFWEKVQKLDQNGNTEDPSYGCMPAGVPRMGPPAKIVQTPAEMIFLYTSGAAQGWGDQYRVIPMDGRPAARPGWNVEGRIAWPLGGRHSSGRQYRLQRHELARHRRVFS